MNRKSHERRQARRAKVASRWPANYANRRPLEHRRARADVDVDPSRTRANENASVRDHRGVDLGTATGVELRPSREALQGHPA